MRKNTSRENVSQITDHIREAFSDVVLRELELDITEDDKIYDADTMTLLQIDNMFLKYCPTQYTIVQHNEIKFNVIENSKLMQSMFGWYCNKLINRGLNILSFNQYIQNNFKGIAAVKISRPNGMIDTVESDLYLNESVRILSLICKLNGTDSMYNFEELDVV